MASAKTWATRFFGGIALATIGAVAAETAVVYRSDEFQKVLKAQENQAQSAPKDMWQAAKDWVYNKLPEVFNPTTANDVAAEYRSSSRAVLNRVIPDFVPPTARELIIEEYTRDRMAVDILRNGRGPLKTRTGQAVTAITQGKVPEPEHPKTYVEKAKDRVKGVTGWAKQYIPNPRH